MDRKALQEEADRISSDINNGRLHIGRVWTELKRLEKIRSLLKDD